MCKECRNFGYGVWEKLQNPALIKLCDSSSVGLNLWKNEGQNSRVGVPLTMEKQHFAFLIYCTILSPTEKH
jgi:hypothetical protein